MLIKSKQKLLRTRLAYDLLKRQLQKELDCCFDIPEESSMRITSINNEILQCDIMLDAIDKDVLNSF